jgi:hypothetical protein
MFFGRGSLSPPFDLALEAAERLVVRVPVFFCLNFCGGLANLAKAPHYSMVRASADKPVIHTPFEDIFNVNDCACGGLLKLINWSFANSGKA